MAAALWRREELWGAVPGSSKPYFWWWICVPFGNDFWTIYVGFCECFISQLTKVNILTHTILILNWPHRIFFRWRDIFMSYAWVCCLFWRLAWLFSNNCEAGYQDRLVPSFKSSPNRNTFSILWGSLEQMKRKITSNTQGGGNREEKYHSSSNNKTIEKGKKNVRQPASVSCQILTVTTVHRVLRLPEAVHVPHWGSAANQSPHTPVPRPQWLAGLCSEALPPHSMLGAECSHSTRRTVCCTKPYNKP